MPRLNKKNLIFLIHLNFLLGMAYALINFLRSAKSAQFFERRLWAYEYWLIFGFYALFLLVAFFQEDENKVIKIHFPKKLTKPAHWAGKLLHRRARRRHET